MAAPSPVQRTVTYERDGHRCVSCGSMWSLQFQHRQAVGMGGSKRGVNLAGGVTSCASCNPEYEGSMQTLALINGWKVPRWVRDVSAVPVRYNGGVWRELLSDGRTRPLSNLHARAMMFEVYGEQYVEWETEQRT